MRLTDLAYDVFASLLTMVWLGLLASPATYFLWNDIIVHVASVGIIAPITWPTAWAVNFLWNIVSFFKLHKRDVIIANAKMEEEAVQVNEENS